MRGRSPPAPWRSSGPRRCRASGARSNSGCWRTARPNSTRASAPPRSGTPPPGKRYWKPRAVTSPGWMATVCATTAGRAWSTATSWRSATRAYCLVSPAPALGVTHRLAQFQGGVQQRGDIEHHLVLGHGQPRHSGGRDQCRRNVNLVTFRVRRPGADPGVAEGSVERAPAQLRGARQRSITAPLSVSQRHGRFRRVGAMRRGHQVLHVLHHLVGIDAHGQVRMWVIGHVRSPSLIFVRPASSLTLKLQYGASRPEFQGTRAHASWNAVKLAGMSEDVMLLVLAAAVVAGGYKIWQTSLDAREAANRIAKDTCSRAVVQFLDGTVAFAGFRWVRQPTGRRRLLRTYTFDYTSDGFERAQGFIVLAGLKLEAVGLAGSPS